MVLPHIPQIRKSLLKFLVNNNEYHSLEECVTYLINHFSLSEEDQQLRYEGKHKEKIVKKRVTLVVSEFRIAQLIEDETKPGNASFRISQTGLDLHKRNYCKITNSILKKFGEYLSLDENNKILEDPLGDEKSEEETLQDSVKQFEQRTQLELLQEIKNRCNSNGFVKLCLKLFEEMGYGEAKHLTQLEDNEIDGIISEDTLGLNQIYIKTKKHDQTILSSDVDQFYLKCIRNKVSGIFVTTSNFSQDTIETLAKDPSIKLINGKRLSEYLYQFNVGIKTFDRIELKQININELDNFN